MSKPLAAAITLKNAAFGWHGHIALRAMSGEFAQGAMTAVVGPNGAGKSTLIKGIMGVLRPLSGSIAIAAPGRAGLAWLPQAAELDRAFPMTILELAAMGAWRRVGAWRRHSQEELDRCMQALETVGLVDLAHRHLDALSGGQMQRALFARLLVQDSPVLILDEPFAAVDRHTTDHLMALLCGLHGQGRTVIAVLHDLDLVRGHFPQCLMLSGGIVAWGSTSTVLSDAYLTVAHQWRERVSA